MEPGAQETLLKAMLARLALYLPEAGGVHGGPGGAEGNRGLMRLAQAKLPPRAGAMPTSTMTKISRGEDDDDDEMNGKKKRASNAGAQNAVRARRRMKHGFEELAETLGLPRDSHKRVILSTANKRLVGLQGQLELLEGAVGEAGGGAILEDELRSFVEIPNDTATLAMEPVIHSIAQFSRKAVPVLPRAAAAGMWMHGKFHSDYKCMWDQGGLGLVVVDVKTGFVMDVNDTGCSILGCARGELNNTKTIMEITHESSHAATWAMLALVMRKPHQVHVFRKRYARKEQAAVDCVAFCWLSFHKHVGDQAEFCHMVIQPFASLKPGPAAPATAAGVVGASAATAPRIPSLEASPATPGWEEFLHSPINLGNTSLGNRPSSGNTPNAVFVASLMADGHSPGPLGGLPNR